MAEAELEILIKLKDETTAQLNQINASLAGVGEATARTATQTEQMSDTMTRLSEVDD